MQSVSGGLTQYHVELLMFSSQNHTVSSLYFFDRPDRREFCAQHGIDFPSHGWIEQEKVSQALFGAAGAKTVRACTESYGVFLWAPEFANAHASFNYEEQHIVIGGVEYGCSEAYYQSMKSLGHPQHEFYHERIRLSSPMSAFQKGNYLPIRSDWDEVRVDVMRTAVYAKFTQNEILKQLLCSTAPYPLVQIKMDRFWGTMADGSGRNMLGVLLQELRAELIALESNI